MRFEGFLGIDLVVVKLSSLPSLTSIFLDIFAPSTANVHKHTHPRIVCEWRGCFYDIIKCGKEGKNR
jgi:hypothetical protein